MPKPLLLTPQRLLAEYENGTITLMQWRAGIRAHCEIALKEAEEELEEPKLALLELWRTKIAVKKLRKKNKDSAIREALFALSELDDFPPAVYLWNADQRSTPLHCFLRETRYPVIRFPIFKITQLRAEIEVEYGSLDKKLSTKEQILLERHWQGDLRLYSRTKIR